MTNVNEAPVVTGDDTPSFQEDSGAAIATYTAVDPDRDTIAWSVSGTDADDFWISSRGQLYFRSPPSFEVQIPYSVTVTATDDDETDNLSGTLAVTVTVTDAEEEGVVALTPTRGWVDVTTQFNAALSDDDGAISGTTWQWARSPNGRSSWTDVASTTPGSYTVTADDANQYLRVTASYEDRRGSNNEAEAVLATPVGETRPVANAAPTFSETGPLSRRVASGTAAGRRVGSPVSATDADPGDVLTYSLQSGEDANAFDIDAETGQIRTRDVLDSEVKDSYTVTVSVHDGFDANYDPSTASDATIEVAIAVTAFVTPPRTSGGGAPSNRPPVFVDGSETDRAVAENTAAGENVGPPVAATGTGNLTHTLGGADAGHFAIVAATGQIQVGDGTVLDHEAEKNAYVVEVTATDPSGAAAMITVTIAVTNQPEAGTVTLSSATPVVAAGLTATLGDPDGEVTGVTWQWARSADLDSWMDIPGATSMTYTPASTDAGYHLRATATYTDALASGQTAMAVTGHAVPEGDPLVARYDANGDTAIDIGELFTAIDDYFDGLISIGELFTIIDLYFSGPA